MSETNKHLIDFVWLIRESICEAEDKAREDILESLNNSLRGRVVRFKYYEQLGISAKPVLKDCIATVAYIKMEDKGYGIQVVTDRGTVLRPHPPFGIEIVNNEPKSVYK